MFNYRTEGHTVTLKGIPIFVPLTLIRRSHHQSAVAVQNCARITDSLF